MLIIGNGRLITRDAEHPYFEQGAVVCGSLYLAAQVRPMLLERL